MDSLKTWFIEVAAKKMVPSLVRAVIAAGVGLLVAHAGVLASLGITYVAATQTITIHLGTLQDWLVMGGLGSITALLTALQHHTEATVTGKPQSGAPPSGAI